MALTNAEALKSAFDAERAQYERAFRIAEDAMRHSIYTDVAIDAMRLAAEAADRAENAWKEYQKAAAANEAA